MSGTDAARRVAAWCVIALALFCNPATAMPVAESDMAQAIVESAPNGAHIGVAAIDPAIPALTPPRDEPFGLQTRSVLSGGLWNKWHGVEAAIRAEHDVLVRCRAGAEPCPPAAARFLAIVAAGRAHAGRARLGQINRAVNLAIRPMSDLAQHGVVDRWSSPLASLSTGLGDCEDYAIAKYVALQEAGVPPDDLRLVIVRDEAANVEHAVVTAHLDGRWIVLDNRYLALLTDKDMRGVAPLFVLDGQGVKQFAPAPIVIAGARNAMPAAATLAAPAGL